MNRLILLAALLPAPAMAAELWCMPETICRGEECHSTTDEETSVRFADMNAGETTMRAHAEDVPMTRANGDSDGDTTVEWSGTNSGGVAEYLIWTRADNAFTYVVTHADGKTRKANGYCEVQ